MSQMFKQVFVVDFEFTTEPQGTPGERPVPLCLVAREVISGRVIRLWRDEFGSEPPYPIDESTLIVAYYASAEMGCHLALGWPMPARVLDLYAEFRQRTNGLILPAGKGLLGASVYFGLDHMDAAEKTDMRDLAIKWFQAPRTAQNRTDLIDYCQTDVDATARLLKAMLPGIDMPPAIAVRGRSMRAVAAMEHVGVPIDTVAQKRLTANWQGIQEGLIEVIDSAYGVFEGRTFKRQKFKNLVTRLGIPWPLTESGEIALDDRTFRHMAKAYPIISPLRELRYSLGQLRLLSDLSVGSDGRNRALLSPFRSRSGRNQPSNAKYIFGPAVWLRGLIRPEPGCGVAYIDWSQQEFGVAAALSGDLAMQDAYLSGDPYLAFAKRAGAVPDHATKDSHSEVRELFKQCVLGVQYGMREYLLAERIGQSHLAARELLAAHREAFRQFWMWSEAAVDHAMLHRSLSTVFGWTIHTGAGADPKSSQSEVSAKLPDAGERRGNAAAGVLLCH